jgi:predicted RNase H-like nuclease (RuvC/YqgF family)
MTAILMRAAPIALAISLLGPAPALAQTPSGAKKTDAGIARQAEAIRNLQASQAQLKAENDKLLADKTVADKARATLEKQLATDRDRVQAQSRRQVGEKESTIARLERELAQARKEATDTGARLKEADGQRQAESMRAQQALARIKEQEALLAQGATDSRDLAGRLTACRGNNIALSGITSDLLTAIERGGYGDALVGTEPFSGYKRVRVEALMQEYRDKVDDQRSALGGR